MIEPSFCDIPAMFLQYSCNDWEQLTKMANTFLIPLSNLSQA